MASIYVYNQNCVMAGRPVSVRFLEQYDDPSEGNDWHKEEVSEDNLEWHLEKGGHYHRTIATTIRNAME